jgi:hypothetical protein
MPNGVSAADLTQKLRGIDFPAKKQDLVERARQNQAEDAVMRVLEAMPDQEYASVKDIAAAIPRAREQTGQGEQRGGQGRSEQGESDNEMARRGGQHSHDNDNKR